MNEQIFRKKSLERVASPEQLNEYIRVSTPGMWMVLAAIVVLLVGVCVWGVVGHLDTTLKTVAVGENGKMTLYVREDAIDTIEPGMEVSIGESEYCIKEISVKPVIAGDGYDEYALHVGEIQQGEWFYTVVLDGSYIEGIHHAEIIVDSVSPMFFVVN